MAKNFPKVMKNIKTQIQAQRTPSMIYTTTSTPRTTPHTWTHHIQTAEKENKNDAEKIFKAVRKKKYNIQKNKDKNCKTLPVRNYASLME